VSEAQTYDFHLIFKGLFRCVPDQRSGRLTVLLVDARSPKSNGHGDPLRDHRAAIEFYLDDWKRDESSEPPSHFAVVKKAKKEAVGIFLLNRHDIQIGVDQGELVPKLTFIEDGTNTSFSRLPRMEEISPRSARVKDASLERGAGCIARVVGLEYGEVRSERTSMFEGKPLQWSFSASRKKKDLEDLLGMSGSSEHSRLKNELHKGGREFNLDLRVTAKVPIESFVVIDPVPFPNVGTPNPTPFMLRPQNGKDLEVWIKNRELDVILTESDAPDSEEECRELIDFDFELQYELSDTPGDILIPYRKETLDEGPVVLAGCACGGCT